MARTANFSDKFKKVDALVAVGNNDDSISRFLKEQLVSLGLVEKVKAPELKKVVDSRGRQPIVYKLTGKGKGYVALSRGWKRPEGAQAPQIVQINLTAQPETVTA